MRVSITYVCQRYYQDKIGYLEIHFSPRNCITIWNYRYPKFWFLWNYLWPLKVYTVESGNRKMSSLSHRKLFSVSSHWMFGQFLHIRSCIQNHFSDSSSNCWKNLLATKMSEKSWDIINDRIYLENRIISPHNPQYHTLLVPHDTTKDIPIIRW